MGLAIRQVIFNPIDEWTSIDYFVGNRVEFFSNYYICIADNSAAPANNPTNPAFWTEIFPTSPNTDVSNFVTPSKEIEIGSGEVRSVNIRFNADQGAFITQTNGGLTPIIDEFDKVRVISIDQEGNEYSAVYEAEIIYPTLDGVQGTVLPVDFLGTEFYLQKTLFAEQFYFKSQFDVTKGICDLYNENRGSLQPTIINYDNSSANGGFNDLPVWTATDYTFNLSEMRHYDGLVNAIDRGGASVAAGGAGDFFELMFDSNPLNQDQIMFRGFSSGNPTDQTSIPNIKSDNVVINPAEQNGEIVATVGNVVGTWSDSSIGTLPRQNADFIGGLEAWQLFPTYVTATYPADSIIQVLNTEDTQGDNFHYKANKITSLAPPTPPAASNADWDQYFFTDFLTNEVDYIIGSYSVWTFAASNQWRDNNARSDGDLQQDPATINTVKVWDSNQVKIDGNVSQTWVDCLAVNFATIPLPFVKDGQVARGFRVLVNGTGLDEFAGFDNMVIQWNGTEWIIFKRPESENLVGSDNGALTYQFDTDTPGAWANISSSLAQANDVYHTVYDIYNSQGHNSKSNGGGGNFGQLSAVTYEFRYKKGDNSPLGLTDPNYYRQFAGVNFRTPFPFSTNNSSIIGQDYTNPTFEAENMGFTSHGLTGFNNEEAEDLGPFDALTFFILHEWRYQFDGSGSLVLTGNYAYRCALYDIDDTVVIQDFVVPFNNLWEAISLPVSGFSTYKARAAWAFGNTGQNIFLQQLEVLDSFRWRNIKKIAIHWLGPYDDQGRYNARYQTDFLFPSLTDTFVGLFTDGYNVKLSIDSFQWSHPGLSMSEPNTERPLMPEFFWEPQISNKYQLDQANLAKKEILQFRHKEYEITLTLFNQLKYGDTFFLESPKLINFAERTVNDLDVWSGATPYIIDDDVQVGGVGYRCIQNNTNQTPPNATFWQVLDNPIPNTIKLVNKKHERTTDKTDGIPGGALSILTGVKRFE